MILEVTWEGLWTLPFGRSQFHGHNSWLVCEVALRHLQSHVVWSRILNCSVKSNVVGPSTKCYFNEFLFMRVLTHDKNKINQWLWAFTLPWSPVFVLGLPPRGGYGQVSKWAWNMIHLMSFRNPCTFYIHLAFTYSVGLSSLVWSELGPAPPCSPMRVLEMYWSRALSLVCKMTLR